MPPSIVETRLAIPSGSLGRSGFSEFSSVFERNQAQLNLTGLVGNNQTYGDEAVASAVHNGLLSAGQFHYQTNGFRSNNDLRHDIYNVFAQASLSPTLSVQADLRSRRTESGDLSLNFDPSSFSRDLDRDLDQDTARIGARYSPSPHSDLIASVIYSNRNDKLLTRQKICCLSTAMFAPDRAGSRAKANGSIGSRTSTFKSGLLAYHTDAELRESFLFEGPPPEPPDRSDLDHEQVSGYSYSNLTFPQTVTWTIGFSYDALISPKFGVRWAVTDGLQIRAAAVRTLKPALLANQTIQPTQIAGFNQFYDDINGTKSWLYGIGLDARLTGSLYAGSEMTRRNLDEAVSIGESSFQSEEAEETAARAYLYWALHPRWALTGELLYDLYDRDESAIDFPRQVKIYAVPVGLRYFHPSGIFTGLGTSFVYQSVERRADTTLPEGDDTFGIVDAGVGYRFPHRRGLISLQVQNLLDHDFNYQDDSYRKVGNEPALSPYIPDQTIIGRLMLNF